MTGDNITVEVPVAQVDVDAVTAAGVVVEVPVHAVAVSTALHDIAVGHVAADVHVDVPAPEVFVSVADAVIEVDVVGKPGPQGGPGPQGPMGPQGVPGTSGARHTHIQSVLSPTWIVEHFLNCHPAVTVEDAAGTTLYGTITYLSDTVLTIGFAYSITGRANCI